MKRLELVMILPLLSLLFFSSHTRAESNDWEEFFFKANQAFKEERFQEAADLYEQIIASGHTNGHIYYNLGNIYVRLGEIGAAVLNYERARLYIPRDADLRFNLDYARDRTVDVFEESQSAMPSTFHWLDTFTLTELLLCFSLMNILLWGFLTLRLFYRMEWMYYAIIIVLVTWVITGFFFGMKWYRFSYDQRAVILEEEVDVLAGPDATDTVLFKIHMGTILNQERSENDWVLIRLPDDKRGWIKGSVVERIHKR